MKVVLTLVFHTNEDETYTDMISVNSVDFNNGVLRLNGPVISDQLETVMEDHPWCCKMHTASGPNTVFRIEIIPNMCDILEMLVRP